MVGKVLGQGSFLATAVHQTYMTICLSLCVMASISVALKLPFNCVNKFCKNESIHGDFIHYMSGNTAFVYIDSQSPASNNIKKTTKKTNNSTYMYVFLKGQPAHVDSL